MAEMTIRRVGVFSVAKMYSIVMFVLGLIIGVIYGLFFMIFGAAMSAMAPRGEGAFGGVGSIVMGLVFMIAFPIFYAVIGFIAGAIGAFIYNLAAGVVGGIKLDLEGVTSDYAPPPPPQQWGANPYQPGQ
ncbi:MAG TPA: hypothetical protein VE135_23845 [Pyrinomonadaceae bacterium]|nr:hypothetical protein [Pyrinomonadaceae bacterium]